MKRKQNVGETAPPEISKTYGPDMMWVAGCALIMVVAAAVRFYDLGRKPFHHDEGVNGFFLTTLFRDGVYKYDPANYHGPTLYYISLAFAKAFGLETVSVRASVAIFGVIIVAMALFLRRYIGKTGSLFAALFLALSPGMVYISRYFIHEIFFVFLSFAIVVCIVFFIEKRPARPITIATAAIILLVCFLPSTLNLASKLAGDNGTALWAYRGAFFIVEAALTAFVLKTLLAWNEGRGIYLILASAFTSLYFATKETAFITLGTMLIACVCVAIWRRIYKERAAGADDGIDDDHLTFANFREAIGTGTDRILLIIAATSIFIYLGVLFFSSFFTYPEGVKAAFEAYAIWTKTGSKDHTQNGWWAYLEWARDVEAPILFLSAVGALIAFLKARHRFAMFVSLWAFGLLAAYTIIPYKTPWLALSFLLPMCLAAGYAINAMATSANASLRTMAVILGLGATVVLTYQTYDNSFVRHSDEDTVYAYAHTNPEFLDLVREIERYAETSGKGTEAKVDIVSPDYWPLVWYLREYKQALFHAHIIDTTDSEMIVAKKGEQDADVIRLYSARYEYVGNYTLRGGVDLVLLVRKDIAGDQGQELYKLDR